MSLRPKLHVSTFQSRTVVSMFGRLCHLFVHALSSLQVANAQCMTLRSLAPCLRAAREKHRFAAGKKHRNGKNTFGSRKKTPCSGKKLFPQREKRQQKMPLRSGKNSKQQKKHLAAAQKHLCSRKNAFWRQREKTVRGGKKPVRGKKKPAEAGKKPAAEKVQLCNPKSCRNGKNTFPQREKAAAPPMRSTDDIHKAASAAARKPQVTASLGAFGTEDVYTAPPQTSSLSLRAAEEWKRCICENQAFSFYIKSKKAAELIKKDGGEMLKPRH